MPPLTEFTTTQLESAQKLQTSMKYKRNCFRALAYMYTGTILTRCSKTQVSFIVYLYFRYDPTEPDLAQLTN